MKRPEDIINAARVAFSTGDFQPRITLRGGDALDGYRKPPVFDPAQDEPTDDYLERYHWGVTYLDPESWKFYLPILIEYSLRKRRDGSSLAIDATLSSLRPPEKTPPRFSTLSDQQEQVISDFLDILAFADGSEFQEDAMKVLEEYWTPGAIYRSRTEQ